MLTLTDFAKGQRVIYRGLKQEYYGKTATVIRPVKSRRVVTIRWDDPAQPWFDAYPERLEIVA